MKVQDTPLLRAGEGRRADRGFARCKGRRGGTGAMASGRRERHHGRHSRQPSPLWASSCDAGAGQQDEVDPDDTLATPQQAQQAAPPPPPPPPTHTPPPPHTQRGGPAHVMPEQGSVTRLTTCRQSQGESRAFIRFPTPSSAGIPYTPICAAFASSARKVLVSWLQTWLEAGPGVPSHHPPET